MISGIIFDYGGVISDGGRDFEPAKRLSENLAINLSLAYEVIDTPWDSLVRGSISVDNFWREIEGALGYNIPGDVRNIWNTYANCMAPRSYMLDLLMELKATGYTLGILSDTVPPTAHSIRLNGGYDAFDFTVLSCDTGFRKPELQIYEAALAELAPKSPRDVIFIDDNHKNLAPASKLGMKTILAEKPSYFIKELKAELATR